MNSALPQKDAAKMENHVFRIYDENNDGHVDFVEFMVVLFFSSLKIKIVFGILTQTNICVF